MKGFVRALLLLALFAPVGFAHAAGTANGKKTAAPAARKKPVMDEVSGQGYGMAGCGLGSILFGPKPGIIQVVSATFNATSANQTFGITTGTLNCDISEMGQEAAMFIELNHENFRTEVARGQGETVESLAYILKCSNPELLGNKMHENYGNILQDGISTYETTRRIQTTIDNNPELKSTCASQIVG